MAPLFGYIAPFGGSEAGGVAVLSAFQGASNPSAALAPASLKFDFCESDGDRRDRGNRLIDLSDDVWDV